MKADLKVLANPAQLAKEAAEVVILIGTQAIEDRAVFALGLSGGSTPKALFEHLASDACRARLDWTKVEIYFMDERCVPPSDNESNYRLAERALLGQLPISSANVHRIKGEIDPARAAKDYDRLLQARFADSGLDLALLGMGNDGHTASLFPRSKALSASNAWCAAQFIEKSTTGRSWRVTLTAPFINRSRNVLVLIAGAAKAKILATVLNGPKNVLDLPIQLIDPPQGQMLWLTDAAAASELR